MPANLVNHSHYSILCQIMGEDSVNYACVMREEKSPDQAFLS
jgi:hypothetical protein